ncbi:MAG: glycoside hydrolase family 30 beta sandwich domain-containing protein, partial [Acidimicrobiia bacterium]
ETVQRMLTEADVTAVDYLWGFFGSYEPSSSLVAITFDQGTYVRHDRTPAYFVTGQFSRFVTPGSVRVMVGPAPASVGLSAFRRPDGKLAVVAVNSSPDDKAVAFSVRGTELRGDVEVTRTSSQERGVALAGMPSAATGFDVSLSPESVTTFLVPTGSRAT